MAVSLGEITGIRGDAQIAGGTAGVGGNLAALPADQIGLQLLDSAANARMLANRYALDFQQQQLRDYLQNFNALEVQGVMESDYPAITAEYAQYAKKLADNYDVIANPFKDQQRYAQLRQEEATLRGRIARSKGDLALRQNYNNFIGQHRDFQTPENLQRLTAFSEQPLGQRDINALTSIAPRFDAMQEDISKQANLIALQKTKEQDTATPFQNEVEMTQYLQNEYNTAVRAFMRGQDGFNRPMIGAVAETFRSQPAETKAQYTNPDGTYRLDDFAVEQLYGPLRMQTNISVVRDPNQFAVIQAQGTESRRNAAAQGAIARENARYAKSLEDEDLSLIASEIPVRQLSIFGAPDQAGAARTPITLRTESTGVPDADKFIQQFSTLFNVKDPRRTDVTEGVPVTLDTWMTNAYSIPGPKRTVIDPDTRKEVESDSYLRPSEAWVTTETDPNARKVIVRYQPEGGQPRDLVLPYAEHFQILNNVAGEKNAPKLGGAKVKLLKDLTGRVTPSYQELDAVEIFRNPNTGGGVTPGAPGAPVAPTGTRANQTTGEFLNATKYKEMLRKQRQGQ